MKTLFIGGYGDGRWIDVPDEYTSCEIQEPLFPDVAMPSTADAAHPKPIRHHLYRSQRLADGQHEWRVFVWVDEERSLIQLLMDGYARGE